MQYKAILFDLDGTLLPMDYDEFSKGYFHLLSKVVAPYGYEKEPFLSAMMKGVGSMVKNNGEVSNCDRFWETFSSLLNPEIYDLIPLFDEFYETEFHKTSALTRPNPLAKDAIRLAEEKAEALVLATNPLFPISAVTARLGWVGLSPEDFDLVTDYESCAFCKPNPAYFTEITETLNVAPEDCLMVGNNVVEDILPAQKLGMKTFLVTDCLIADVPIPEGPQGTFDELIQFLISI